MDGDLRLTSAADHIRRSTSARESYDHFRLTFVEHPLISDRSGGAPVRGPVGAEFEIVDAPLSRPIPSNTVNAPRVTLNHSVNLIASRKFI